MEERLNYLAMVLWAAKYRTGLRLTALRSKAKKFKLNEWLGVRLWAIRHEKAYRNKFIFKLLAIAVIVLLIVDIRETVVY